MHQKELTKLQENLTSNFQKIDEVNKKYLGQGKRKNFNYVQHKPKTQSTSEISELCR